MTKADIINEISMSTGLQKKEVAAVVECFMSTVKDSLLNKRENVYLRGFGKIGRASCRERVFLRV